MLNNYRLRSGLESVKGASMMNVKRGSLFLTVLILVFLIAVRPVFAIGDDRFSRPSLKGLKKLSVFLKIQEKLSEDFKKSGLTEDRIRTAIELKLREAKIDVVYIESLPTDTPILYLEVGGSNRNGKTFLFVMEMELWQKGFLKRDPKSEVIAATWSTGVFGLGSASTIANDMIGLVNGMMGTFLEAYTSANP